MTTVDFTSFSMADNADALTVEGVFKKYGAFAGLHGYEFDNRISSFEVGQWTNITGVSYGDTMERTGTVLGDIITWYTPDMPHSYLVEFTYHQDIWSIILRGTGTNSYYKLEYHKEFSYVYLYKLDNGTQTTLEQKQLPDAEKIDWGRAKVSVRDTQFTSDSSGRIIYISLWINDVLILSASDNATNVPLLRMGFIVYAGDAALLYSDLKVANLGEVLPISSLDPAEKPLGAIQRAIEDRYIRYWMRWNGKLRAWKPAARANAITVSRSKEFSLSLSMDIRQIINHIRVLGAFQWVTVKDDALIRAFGNRFRELQNTSLWNADDCYAIGLDMLIRAKEQAFQAQFVTYGLVLLEIEDRIKLPDVKSPSAYIDYIIDNIRWSYNAGTFKTDGTGRQYLYGEL